MKRILVLFGLVLFLVACGSNYPDQAMIDFGAIESQGARTSGFIIELNPAIVEDAHDFSKKIDEAFAFLETPSMQGISFLGDLSQERQARFAELTEDISRAQQAQMQQYEQWRSEAQENLQELVAKRNEWKESWEEFDSFLEQPAALIYSLEQEIERLEKRQSEIVEHAMSVTNRRIVDEMLPVRQIGPGRGLSWSESTWRDGLDLTSESCEDQAGRVTLDQIAERRSCVYIQYPVSGIESSEYDSLLRDSVEELLEIEANVGQPRRGRSPATGLRGELQQAQGSLRDAIIIAENQTGLNQRTVEQQRRNLDREIATLRRNLDFADEQVAKGAFPSLSGVNQVAGNVARRELEQIFQNHFNEFQVEVVHRNILNQVPIDANGKVSGLSGAGGLMVALVNVFYVWGPSIYVIRVDTSGDEFNVIDGKIVFDIDEREFETSGSLERAGRLEEIVLELFSEA